MKFLSGLPADYLVTVGFLETNNFTFEAAMPGLITAEQRIAMKRERKGSTGRDTGVALAAAKDITCYGCGRRGHIQHHCQSNSGGAGRAPAQGHCAPVRTTHIRACCGGGGRNGAPRPVNSRAAGSGPPDLRPLPHAEDAHALSAIAVGDTPAMACLCENGVAPKLAATGELLIVSGASHHMTHTLDVMLHVKWIIPMRINMANG